MTLVLRSDFEVVRAQLEDAQESLAAAFARIEVFRQREKLLLAELAKLRTATATAAAAPAPAAAAAPAGASTADGSTPSSSSGQALAAAAPAPQDAPAAAAASDAAAAAPSSNPWPLPAYVTEVEGHLPVMLLASGSSKRATPGSIVVTHDFIDFVEVRARVKRQDFIGIASAPAAGAAGGKASSSSPSSSPKKAAAAAAAQAAASGSSSNGGVSGLVGSSSAMGLLRLKDFLPACMSSGSAQHPAVLQEDAGEQLETALQQQQQHLKPPGMPHLRVLQQPVPAALTQPLAAAMPWAAVAPADHHQHAQQQQQQRSPWGSSSDLPGVQQQQAAPGSGSPPHGQKPWLAAAPDTPHPPQQQQQDVSGWASPQALRHCTTWQRGGGGTPAAETELTAAGLTAAAAAARGSKSPSGLRSSGAGAGASEKGSGPEPRGVWKVLWRSGGMQQQLTFEATLTTREVLHRHTLCWLGQHTSEGGAGTADPLGQLAAAAAGGGGSGGCSSSTGGGEGPSPAAAAGAAGSSSGVAVVVPPRHLSPGSCTPRLSEPSVILLSEVPAAAAAAAAAFGGGDAGSSSPVAAAGGGLSPRSTAAATGLLVSGLSHVAGALPSRFRSRSWSLLYSTGRHGISLQTLYRRAASVQGGAASVLLVRDGGGYVFGAFCPEPWRPSPRFFGSGEAFVFQLAPHKVMWPWRSQSELKNDFFQYAQPDALGVGGLGAFAIWLDGELLDGSSGACGTFGSPCLASREEFRIAAVELWSLQQ